MTSTSGSDGWPSVTEETTELPPFDVTVTLSDAVPPSERTAVLPPITDFEETVPSTGWTATIPVIRPQQAAVAPAANPAPAAPQAPAPAPVPAATPAPLGVGAGPRGRILVVEGGYGASGRRHWGRNGSAQAPVLSAMLAAVSPQILLAVDSVDAVHLPGAADPQSVLAHLRAAARHPGPLLVHLGGHLVADRRGGHLYLTLRDSKAGTVRQDGLPWQAIAAELRHRPAEWDTLVIADLSADQAAWPQLQSAITPLADGLPLWAVVSPDPEQIGTFTRALIEALHGGRPGAEAVLAPEQLRQQVHSVLRPDVIILSSHPADRPIFRNTARRLGEGPAENRPYEGPRPSAVLPKPQGRAAQPRPASANPVILAKAPAPAPTPAPVAPPRRGVTLLKAGVPPTPPRPPRPVSLLKVSDLPEPAPMLAEPIAGPVTLTKPQPQPQPEPEPRPEPVQDPAPASPPVTAPVRLAKAAAAPETPAADYREAIGRIVRSADAGEHATAAELALELERQAVAAHGPVAPAVLQVRQVRAHVSRLAGLLPLAAEIYREVALTLLRSQGPDHPETQQAATNAEACWRAIPDRVEAIRVAPEIIELRAYLPGPEGRKLRAAERYLKQLAATPQPES
ncbi:hypothetical protein [Kitasatospora atroaurantiaca]|uniref:Tetratricopeptide repeat protein n=1 Tax=Kitasatospora atroaurantiaca TaxID=285545 RepID=A0A561EYP3_9ACTN|nr:hypothetical protein [Kitasatospora atroaurantiaca]TWE20730.1 hypothetical protein FB465_5888 [Kitasatospora atroaurantiaca]